MTVRSPAMRRQRLIVWIACIATAVSVIVLGLSAFVKSPAQKAAEAEPPRPSVITVPVSTEVLTATVVTRGTVVVGTSIPVVGLSSGNNSSRIVTSLSRKAGDEVRSGDLLAQVSGRPIFLLKGRTPAFRDLTPGTSGRDVRQVQRALRSLGYAYAPDRAGSFGRGTQRAVSRFYRAVGFAPLTTGDLDPAQDSAIDAAEDALTGARRALERARSAAASLRGTERRAAQREIRYAREDLSAASARLARVQHETGTVWPLAELVFASRMPAAVGTLTASVTDDVRALELPGTVESVGEFQAATTGGSPGDTDAAPSGYPVLIKGADPFPITWLGRDVRVQIVVSRTDHPVLTVPRAALVASPDNTTWVTVSGPDGSQTPVQVVTGMAAAGEVEIVPSDPSALKAGSLVVIG